MSNRIPCIYAGDLPQEVEDEMRATFGDELCYHGDGGCVFYAKKKDLDAAPLFKAWMIEGGWWTEEEADLTSYEEYCLANNLNESGEPYHFKEYFEYKKISGKEDSLQVAMTGT